jgi:hypothetical protein
MIALGDVFKSWIKKINESGLKQSKKLKTGNEEFEEMLLRELIHDLTSDEANGPPDSFIILFHPYFVVNLKLAKDRVQGFWNAPENREFRRRFFTKELLKKWLDSLSRPHQRMIEGEDPEVIASFDFEEVFVMDVYYISCLNSLFCSNCRI